MTTETKRILINRVRCRICGDVIESAHRHDFVRCSCGNCYVDGGHDYVRFGGDPAMVEMLTEYADA